MERTSFNRLISSLRRKLYGLTARAVTLFVDDSKAMQTMQLGALDNELLDEVERFQNYGFTSHPHSGAEAAFICLGAERTHAIVLAVDDRRYRLTALKAGEVAMYTDEGDSIHFKRGNTIALTTKHLEVMASDRISMTTKEFRVVATSGSSFVTPSFMASGSTGASSATFSGTLHSTGNITTDADVVAQSISLQGHVHSETNGSTTEAPQ